MPPALRLAADGLSATGRAASLRAVAAVGCHLLFALVLGGTARSASIATRRVAPFARWLGDALRCAAITTVLVALWMAREGRGVDVTVLLLAGVAGVLVPAIAEETVYRGILPWMLDGSFGATLPHRVTHRVSRRAIIALLTSLAFGAAHPGVLALPFDAAVLIEHTVAGLAFFALRGDRNTLLAPMCAHVAYNGAVLLAMNR